MKVDHLEHLESLVFYGEQGARQALDIIENIENYKLTVKFDGSPSILFGWDEKNKFFLATKSIFNKTPKRNYSHEDIDINHGTNPGLTEKLKKIFYDLKSVCEFRLAINHERFVVQGDLMFTEGDLSFDGDAWRCKENMLEYAFGGLNLPNYKMGIALHTVYQYQNNELVMRPDIDIANFRQLDNAYTNILVFMDVAEISHGGMELQLYSNHIRDHMKRAIEYNSVNTREALQAVNKVIRAGDRISTNRVMKEMPAWTDRKLIELHQMFYNAKNYILHHVRRYDYPFIRVYLNGQAASHEGYVVALPDGTKIKLVDREVFSAANFERWA